MSIAAPVEHMLPLIQTTYKTEISYETHGPD